MPDDTTVSDCAKHLVLIANDLRAAGDVNLVALSEEGVTPQWMTLADELWLIAVRLGWPIDGQIHNDGPACDHCHHEVDHYAWCPNDGQSTRDTRY